MDLGRRGRGIADMTIEDFDKVDVMGTRRETGGVALCISDHLPWDARGEHFAILQRKLGTYLNFIKSGQVWERSSADRSVPIRIELIHKYPPTPLAERFLSAARDQLRSEEGIEFTWEGLEQEGET